MKLDDDDELAKFHAKYWGMSMDKEEKEWRAKQPEVLTNDEDNDIISGCYFLDFSDEASREIFGINGIWIRVSTLAMGKINMLMNLAG